MAAELVERHYLSRYSSEQVGFTLHVAGIVADADGAVTARLYRADTDTTIAQRAATHLGLGQYGITVSSVESSTPAPYDVAFTYLVGGVAQVTVIYLVVGPAAPAYDALPAGWRSAVESVWIRLADAFDSPYGGPYLQVPRQSSFGRNRLAQLLGMAVGRLNTISQPQSTYSTSGEFPFAQWGPLAEQALYVEALRHLVRSYVEQPDVQLGSAVSRLDRRDYMDRWSAVLKDAQDDLERQLDSFRMANLGLGAARVLVSGGVYPRSASEAPLPYGAAARGYFPGRYL